MGAPTLPKSPSKSPKSSRRSSPKSSRRSSPKSSRRSRSKSSSRSARSRVIPPPPTRRPIAPLRRVIPEPRRIDVIGKGGYGCAIRPVIPCKDEENNLRAHRLLKGRKLISKLFFRGLEGHIDKVQERNRIALISGAKDVGVKSIECDIEDKYRENFDCDSEKLSKRQLIMEDLGIFSVIDIDKEQKRRNPEKYREFMDNLELVSYEELVDAIESNLESIRRLHQGIGGRVGYIHFDIKAENTMVEFKPKLRLRLIDLDLMKELNSNDILKTSQGKFRYERIYYYPADLNYLALKISGISKADYRAFYEKKFIDHLETMKAWCGKGVSDTMLELVQIPGETKEESINLVVDSNKDYIDNLYRKMIDSGRLYNHPEFLEYIKGIDYYMYGLMILPLLYEYRKTIGVRSERLEILINRVSLLINPDITLRQRTLE